ncbi:hypothetical protein DKX38_001846 [Salix brachista]|uniref:DUF7796 domain-containing protein n=1 Tax=Salix brachista TaxID=2182728 RepID=A0A5N5NMS5_9ROSI|nr:hypothetical protein DKX38_001846 [Salix brachista]
MIVQSPQKMTIPPFMSRWFSDLYWKPLLFTIPPLTLLLLLTVSLTPINPFSSFPPLASQFLNKTASLITRPSAAATTTSTSSNSSIAPPSLAPVNRSGSNPLNDELRRSRMAVCLVGGARRFELTGPSIVKNILEVYPNSDLFLHSNFDDKAFKFSLLKSVSRLASVRIIHPKLLPETLPQLRVLTAANSPNGIQGLLQYFNLVEGCLTMIQEFQTLNGFKYDWIIRTRVDGYWNAPLGPENFIPGHYLVPPGSTYGGLNDRLGIGDLNTSTVALSRLSLVPQLDAAGFHQLNSETAFKAQLTTQGVPFVTKRLPFCIVTDRRYEFPPKRFGVPVAALSSPGPLSGAKCRPCNPVCEGSCAGNVMESLYKGWSWTAWENGTLKLCDAHGEWGRGWEKIFDRVAGKELATGRKMISGLKEKQCLDDFNEMKKRAFKWDSPPVEEICRLGLGQKN